MVRQRGLTHYEADARRRLRGRDPVYLRTFIGRRMVALLAADDEIREQTGERFLPRNTRRILEVLAPLAVAGKDIR